MSRKDKIPPIPPSSILCGLQTPKHITPLLLAAEKGHAAACTALLTGGASPAAKTPAGDTPILLAIKARSSTGRF